MFYSAWLQFAARPGTPRTMIVTPDFRRLATATIADAMDAKQRKKLKT